MSPKIRYDERMGASDALLWNNERDPMLRSTILSLLLLDRAPDAERLRAAVDRSLETVPRLRQRVALDPLGAAPPRWETDPHFELGYHLRRAGVPGTGTLRDVLAYAEPVAMQAFDKDRPLWELHQLDALDGGRSAILMKLHHAVSDGVGLVRMTSSLVERSREPEPRRSARPPPSVLEEPGPRGPFEDTLRALLHRAESNLDLTARAAASLRRSAGGWLRDPLGSARSAADVVGSLRRLLAPISKPMSPLLSDRSLALRLDACSLPMEDLKRAGKAIGGTLNDAFVGAVTGGLRLFHEHHGRPVEELRMTMPINVRSGEAGQRAGNQFVPARFAVPIGIADPAERMRETRRRILAQRGERALPLTEDVSALLARLPRTVSVPLFGSMLKAIDFVTSNVPGPQFPVFASGAHVEQMFGFGPLSGAAASVTLFSYDGQAQLGISTDRAAVRDAPFFVECLEKGAQEVLALA